MNDTVNCRGRVKLKYSSEYWQSLLQIGIAYYIVNFIHENTIKVFKVNTSQDLHTWVQKK